MTHEQTLNEAKTSTDQEWLLDVILRNEKDVEIIQAVLDNPNIHSSTMIKLFRQAVNMDTFKILLSSKVCPAAVLAEALKDQDMTIRQLALVYGNRLTVQTMGYQPKAGGIVTKGRIKAAAPVTTKPKPAAKKIDAAKKTQLKKTARQPKKPVPQKSKAALASKINPAAKKLQSLKIDDVIKMTIVKNKNRSEKFIETKIQNYLRQIATYSKKHDEVQDAINSNEITADTLIQAFNQTPHKFTRAAILKTDTCPPEILCEVMTNKAKFTPEIRLKALNHPNATLQVLQIAMDDRSDRVIQCAAGHSLLDSNIPIVNVETWKEKQTRQLQDKFKKRVARQRKANQSRQNALQAQ